MGLKRAELWKQCLLEYTKLSAATGFLSILVLPGSQRLFAHQEAGEVAPLLGAEYFPVVGALLALFLAMGVWIAAPLLPQMVLAALLVVALVILTGGLHLDGLMDTCDGLFGGRTLERKLEIMRDSRVGSFGVLAGACSLLLKFACLASSREQAWPLMLFVCLPSARWSLVLALRLFPSARASGLGASFRRAITSQGLLLAGGSTLIIVLLSAGIIGMLVWTAMTLTALALGTWITRKLGGLTGDIYGAIAEITEIVGLLAFVLLHV